MNKNVEEKLKTLPETPGVYIMKNIDGEVIYVGKAVSLKNRVRQYFSASRKEPKVAAMVASVNDFDYVMTDSEKEALILECNMIKRYMPYYNILLKDDKHYPYIKVTVQEDYPRVEIVRKVQDDGARYFGPYTSAILIREVMDTVNRVFMVRHCKKDIAKALAKGERPCLNFEIKRCDAPCTGNISIEDYRKNINDVIEFLSGKETALIKRLNEQMLLHSENMEYEKAAVLRDRIAGIRHMFEKQKADISSAGEKDVFALSIEENEAVIQVLKIRNGKMEQTDSFSSSFMEENDSEIMAQALMQYYMQNEDIPSEIIIASEADNAQTVAEALSEKKGRKVSIKCPKKGDAKRLADMAKLNADETLFRKINHRQREYERTQGAAKRLKNHLRLTEDLERIECYDISNIQGTDSVASMVVFTNGRPDYKEYRHFKIKTVEGANDFASMNEVLERRFLRLLTEGEEGKFSKKPDLIVIDGGKGQLSFAYDALASLGLENIPIIGLAKKMEEVFLPFETTPLIIDKNDEALKLLQRIRDEAHRFAITFHRSLRDKRIRSSVLLNIEGIGEKRAIALFKRFSTISNMKDASLEELAQTPGLNAAAAKKVYEHFRKKD